MRFTDSEIASAIKLKQLGLAWEPAVGHYVCDTGRVVKPSSPFQDGVYFLLNYDCFMERVGGLDRFKTIMTWLPTWSDARLVLRSFGVSDEEVQRRLVAANALIHGTELRELYRLITECLVDQGKCIASAPLASPNDAAQRRECDATQQGVAEVSDTSGLLPRA